MQYISIVNNDNRTSKRPQDCSINWWLSARIDNREQSFIQVGASLFESSEFNSLSYGAQILYLRMAQTAKFNDTFSFSQKDAREAGISSRNSFCNWKKELIEAGFITCIKNGKKQRKKNVYRFSPVWKMKESVE